MGSLHFFNHMVSHVLLYSIYSTCYSVCSTFTHPHCTIYPPSIHGLSWTSRRVIQVDIGLQRYTLYPTIASKNLISHLLQQGPYWSHESYHIRNDQSRWKDCRGMWCCPHISGEHGGLAQLCLTCYTMLKLIANRRGPTTFKLQRTSFPFWNFRPKFATRYTGSL